MSIGNLYATATGMSGIKSLTLREGMSQPAVQVDVVCSTVTAQVGDSCDVDFGYDTDHAVMLTGGFVKKITQRRPSQDYEVSVSDNISRAVDYFIASDTPDAPFTATNRKAQDLVSDLLVLAGLSLSAFDATIFTFGIDSAGNNKPVPINLITSWSFIEHINRICGYTTYALANGNIEFRSRKPYITGGDVSEHTFSSGSSGDILEIGYWRSDENLRNKVVVYGAPGITSTTSGSSPYLPAGFYKTLVVAHEIITNQASADGTGAVNLTMFNRLTENCSLKVVGSKNYRCRDIVAVSEAFTGLTAASPWVVFAAVHTLNRQGYSCDLTLTR